MAAPVDRGGQGAHKGAKDKPGIESFWSPFKAENHSLRIETQTLEEVIGVGDRQRRYYHTKRRHSRLAYQTPLEDLHTKGMLPKALRRT